MSFIAGTPIFTDSGWKNIEDISGRDKVLVRNFIGDAEFIQPFAIKRKKYDGDVLVFGSRKWKITITPYHIVEYVRATKNIYYSKIMRNKADSIQYNPKNVIMRHFKYIDGETTQLRIRCNKNDYKSLSYEDWSILLAYTLTRGNIDKKTKTYKVSFNVRPEESQELCIILDNNNILWSSRNGRIYIDKNNNLAPKLVETLGSNKVSSMYLPNKLIFNIPLHCKELFMDNFIKLGMSRVAQESRWMLATSNKKLIDSIILLGCLSSYSVTYRVVVKSGKKMFNSIIKNDAYQMFVQFPKMSVNIPNPIVKHYNGYVYSIDIFEGQIYTGEGSVPIWMLPK